MTNISNVGSSSSLLAGYLQSTSSADLDSKTIFKKLSIDMGGDGKTITKDQLNTYITNAESDTSTVSDEELAALKTLQEKWDTISNGGDKITYANMSNYKDILTSMDSADEEITLPDSFQTAAENKIDINSYLIESAFSFNAYEDEDSTSNWTSLLKTLLTGTTDENDDENANMIATLINLIADAQSNTSVDVEA